MIKPQASIVIPAYNAEATIRETLESVRQQSIGNWTCLVIDDGSEDRTAEIVRSFHARDRRIDLVAQANAGVSAARNTGIKLSPGPFIAFLDADDTWFPGYLETTLRLLHEDARCGVAFTQVNICDGGCAQTGARTRAKLSEFDLRDLLAANPTTTCSNLVVRREVFADAGVFRPGMNHAEDQLWLVSVHLSGWKLQGVEEALVNYRTSTSGLSADLERMLSGFEYLVSYARLRSGSLSEGDIRWARAEYLRYLARRALRTHAGTPTSLSYMARALKQNWLMPLERPWPTIPILAAGLMQAAGLQIATS